MTEQEWQACTDPRVLLVALAGEVSNRKLWLASCGCCRRHVALMQDDRCRTAVEVGERYADGQATADELLDSGDAALLRRDEVIDDRLLATLATAAGFCVVDPDHRDPDLPPQPVASCVQRTFKALTLATRLSVGPLEDRTGDSARKRAAADEFAAQCRVLRCVTRNPFRPAAIDPTWLSWNGGAVAALAQATYDERLLHEGHLDPARLAVLADALEDAGCSDPDILGHLRSPGPHVRGCWVVDLILGKQ